MVLVAGIAGKVTHTGLFFVPALVAVAANGYRLAAVVAAVSAAAWFDFFLTMLYQRFTITRRTDIETTVLLLAIGVAVTEIAVWGRRQHGTAAPRAGYLEGINAAARAVATGGSASALTGQVCGAADRIAVAVGVPVPGRDRGDRQPGAAVA